MNVLIISYMYPPMSGGGVQRIHSLSEFLSEMHEVTVYTETVKNYRYDVYDNTNTVDTRVEVLTKLGKEGSEKRKRLVIASEHGGGSKNGKFRGLKTSLKAVASYFLPDANIGFLINGLKSMVGMKIGFDVVIGTVRPPSNALIAYFYAVINRVPLIVEYRDLWYGQEFQQNLWSPFQWFYEFLVLRRAEKIVVVSPAYSKILGLRFPSVKSKIFLITNGFPESLLAKRKIGKLNSKVISHFGRFYGPRSPDVLLDVLRDSFEDVKLEHYGPAYETDALNFENMGHISFEDSWRIQSEPSSGILLIIEGTSDNIPGKLYEYYATGKPILCIIPMESVIRSIFMDVDSIYFAEPTKESITAALVSAQNAELDMTIDNNDKFSRASCNQQYLTLIDEVTRNN